MPRFEVEGAVQNEVATPDARCRHDAIAPARGLIRRVGWQTPQTHRRRADAELRNVCSRICAATAAVPLDDWTIEELDAFATFLEAVAAARRPVDEVGNVVYLARRR
jgi:hypothetical protein